MAEGDIACEENVQGVRVEVRYHGIGAVFRGVDEPQTVLISRKVHIVVVFVEVVDVVTVTIGSSYTVQRSTHQSRRAVKLKVIYFKLPCDKEERVQD